MYFDAFLQMARQRDNWAPQRVRRVAWSLISNLGSQIELFRILSLPAFKSLVLLDPVFAGTIRTNVEEQGLAIAEARRQAGKVKRSVRDLRLRDVCTGCRRQRNVVR